MDRKEIFCRVDHTLLYPVTTWEQIRVLCDQAIAFGAASVCIPSCYVKQAHEYVAGRMTICTVVGFPNGNTTPACKAFEAKEAVGDLVLKVIIETCDLTEEEKITMCDIVTESGADFIKTSTGFSKGGATFEDIALFKAHVGPNVKIKAAGGIASFADAEHFIELGADRLGTSRIIKLALQEKVEEGTY